MKVGIKTVMGTILSISSHSPFAAEATYGGRLQLFWPAAFQVFRSEGGNPELSGTAF